MASSSTTAVMADRVVSNDPELEHLYLSSDTFASLAQVEQFAQALASNQNTHLQHIYFRNFKLKGPLPVLLQSISQLHNLQSVFFHCSEVSVPQLARVFRRSQWTALGLRYCKLNYETAEDLERLDEALRSDTTLEDVCIECCEWEPEDQTASENNNVLQTSSFLRATASIPTMLHVECVLNPTHSQQRLSASTIHCLGQIRSLETLRMRNVWMPQPDVALLCHSLSSTTTLQKLILSCDMGTTSALALGQLLHSLPLQHLALRMDQLENSDSPELLAAALSRCSLQHFHLSGQAAGQLSTRAKSAFRDTIKCNSSLEFVRLEVNDYALQSEIAFYLQLNHKGRRALLQNLKALSQQEESNLWVQALCQNATDVRALHYFLALNPGLFATVALQSVKEQQSCAPTAMVDWEDEDGLLYDSDGW